VDHCNIACLDCNHGAPGLGPRYADPGVVSDDFSKLAKVYRAEWIKIIGGEPLLHPDLSALIRVLRASRISSKIVMFTNGLLLDRMSDDVWRGLDRIEISHYPHVALEEGLLRHIHARAVQHGVQIQRFYYQNFRATFSLIGTKDNELARRIYRTCKLANLWGCQSIHRGRFYKCPQSIYIPHLVDCFGVSSDREDGLTIEESALFFDSLKDYLVSKEPLAACRYCLGSVGLHRPHRLVKRSEWRSIHEKPTEALIDFARLRELESGRSAPEIQKELIVDDLR
jgi:MoaA/NifB/PqqE/SkfB family radical SAM enzyme